MIYVFGYSLERATMKYYFDLVCISLPVLTTVQKKNYNVIVPLGSIFTIRQELFLHKYLKGGRSSLLTYNVTRDSPPTLIFGENHCLLVPQRDFSTSQ
jgi:hypothetical protein